MDKVYLLKKVNSKTGNEEFCAAVLNIETVERWMNKPEKDKGIYSWEEVIIYDNLNENQLYTLRNSD